MRQNVLFSRRWSCCLRRIVCACAKRFSSTLIRFTVTNTCVCVNKRSFKRTYIYCSTVWCSFSSYLNKDHMSKSTSQQLWSIRLHCFLRKKIVCGVKTHEVTRLLLSYNNPKHDYQADTSGRHLTSSARSDNGGFLWRRPRPLKRQQSLLTRSQ